MVERDALVGSAAVDKRSEASVPERRRLAPVARGKRLEQDLVGAQVRRLAKRLHKYKQKQDDYRSFNCGFHIDSSADYFSLKPVPTNCAMSRPVSSATSTFTTHELRPSFL